MKFKKNLEGAMGGKALILVAVVLVVAVLLLSGLVAIDLPTAKDKYSETVNRSVTDIGIKIPIVVKLTFAQTANTGANRANIDVSIKHKHASGSDYVPDATLISNSNFNTQVANVNDVTTIYAVNGNSFQASNVTLNTTLTSLGSVQFGYAQTNPKVWTKSTTHTPSLSDNNHVIVVQAQFDHYRKATNELLNSQVITFGVYYKMPIYNGEDTYDASYTYYVYIPFDDYAVVEDIKLKVRGYYDSCVVQWKEITTTSRSYWSIDLFGITVFKVVKQKDNTLTSNLIYDWQDPRAYGVDNNNNYGSHSYTYKIR